MDNRIKLLHLIILKHCKI